MKSALSPLGNARSQHTATPLTSGSVLIAGGLNASALTSAELMQPVTGVATTTGSLATARYRHGAVLLRNGDVLVAGGFSGSAALASAEKYSASAGTWSSAGTLVTATSDPTVTVLSDGRVLLTGGSAGAAPSQLYNPSTNTWTTTGAPLVSRTGHTATLLTNGRVLVAGGFNGSAYVNSAELYDPATGLWTATGNLTGARGDHTATVLTDGRVLVMGGRAAASPSLATAELYNPGAGTWSATSNVMPNARRWHASTLLPNGRVLAVGGYNDSPGALAAVDSYDPSTNTWSATTALGTGSYRHTATLLFTGRVLVGGGLNTAGAAIARTELYDPLVDNVTSTSNLASRRCWHGSALLPDGRALIIGGYDGTSGQYSTTELYNPATGTFTAGPLVPGPARDSYTVTTLLNGRVLVVGGEDSNPHDESSLYNPVTNTFTAITPIPGIRLDHRAVLLPDGRVLVAGGTNNVTDLTTAYLYNPTAGTWTSVGPTLTGHTHGTMTLLPNGKVLYVGGESGGSPTNAAELYDPVANTWTSAGTVGAARTRHAMTLLPSGRVLLAGGSSGVTACQLYDPSTNTWSATGSLSTARADAILTALPSGRVLMASGQTGTANSTIVNTTEIYDPATGTWSAGPTMATGHGAHASITVLPNGQVLMAGGRGNSNNAVQSVELFDEGWGASPAWTPVLDTPLPNLIAGGSATLSGTGFTGVSEGGGGGSNSSATNAPIFILTRPNDGFDGTASQIFARPSGWSATNATLTLPAGVQPAWYWLRVVVNGVSSVARPILVTLPTSNRLAFTTPARAFVTSTCPGAAKVIRVQLQTSGGTPTNAGAGGQAITASSSSTGTVTWYTDSGCTTVAAGGAFTIPNGSNSVDLYYRDTASGTPLVRITNASALTDPSPQAQTLFTTATRLAFVTPPASTVAGSALTPGVQVAIQDASGTTVTTSTATVTLALGSNPGGSTLSGTLSVAAVNGVATFSNLSLNRTGSGYTLAASSVGLTAATSSVFNITAGPATQLVITSQPGNAQAGATLSNVQVTVRDAAGNTVTGSSASIALAIANNPGGSTLSGTTPATAVSGVATFSNLSLNRVGTGYTLTASSAGLTSATTNGFDISAGPATLLAIQIQPSSATAGAALSPAVQVAIRDASGNTVTSSSATILIAIGSNPGGSLLSGTTSVSASSGVATFSTLSLNRAGTGYSLVASSAGLTSATSSNFNINAGAASRLAFTVQPGNTSAGATLTPALQIAVQDAQGNTVTGATNTIALALASNPGGSTLSGTTSLAASSGVTTFSNLSLNRAGTGYTLQATAAGLTSATSNGFDIAAGGAARVAFLTPPSNVVAGSSIAPAVRVAIQDAAGNTVTSSSATVTVAIGSNPGGATLAGTTSAAASAGIATFSNLSLADAATGYTLTTASAGLTGATSSAFDVLPATATRLIFAVQPSTTTAGAAIAPALRVEVQDNLGNVVTTSSAPITVALSNNPGGSTLSGTTLLSASSGVATFSGLSLNKTGTGYTLTASSAGFIGAVSNAFNINPGAAASLGFTVQPSATAAGAAITPAVRVAVLDANGNTVTGSAATVTLALGSNPGASTLTGTLSTAAAAGVATFSNLRLNNVGSGYTIVASSAGITSATSVPFTIAAGAASALSFSVPPSNTNAGAAVAPAVQVSIQDAQGNVVSSSAVISLSLASNPVGAMLGGTVSLAAVNGVATFSNLSLDKSGTGFTLSAASAGLTASTSPPFSIAGGTASKLSFLTPARSVGAGVCSPVVTVEAQDALNNPATLSSALALTLTLPGAQLFADAACGSALGAMSLSPGSPRASLYFRSSASAALTLTATATPLPAVTQNESVNPGAAVALDVRGYPVSAPAGQSAPVTVTARDAFGNRATGFTGALVFASSDTAAQLPSGLSLSAGDQGEMTTQVSFRTVGAQEVRVTSGAVSGTQAGIQVRPGPLHHFAVGGVATTLPVERWSDLAISAFDNFGNLASDYTGTVRFLSTDAFAVVPVAFTFNAANQGATTLTKALRFRTAGTQSLTVQDATNPLLFGVQSGIVVTDSAPPLITHDANRRAAVGLPYRYNGLGRVLAEGSAPMTFLPCGAPVELKLDAQTGTVDWVPSTVGIDSICVMVSNAFGSDAYTFTVTVESRTPTAVVAVALAQPATGRAPLDVAFDVAGSQADPTALPMMYQWSFGDGSPQDTAPTPLHRYVLPGGYLARLRVFDAFGAESEAQARIQVSTAAGAKPPSARIVASATEGNGELRVTFTCDCQAGDSPITAYRWDLGNGEQRQGASVEATYAPGGYTARLTVVDASGLGATDEVQLRVNREGLKPPSCVATADAPAGDAPLGTFWKGTALAGSAPIVSQKWVVDGEQIAGSEVRRLYATAGIHEGRFTVEDSNGLTCEATLTVTVSNAGVVPPRLISLAPPLTRCGEALVYSAAVLGEGPWSYALSEAPPGMTVDEAGVVHWKPSRADVGPRAVTLKLAGNAGDAEQSFVLNVECGERVGYALGCGCGASGAAPIHALLAAALLFRAALLRLPRRR
ncbi:MAG: kelch repeat-containing protein [Myxococcaceae bacterium]